MLDNSVVHNMFYSENQGICEENDDPPLMAFYLHVERGFKSFELATKELGELAIC